MESGRFHALQGAIHVFGQLQRFRVSQVEETEDKHLWNQTREETSVKVWVENLRLKTVCAAVLLSRQS